MESWMLGPPLLIGEKVFYTKHGLIASGIVKWLGRLQEVFGNQMACGILMDEPLVHGGCDGTFRDRKIFSCPPNHGLFAQLNDVVKYEDFLFANPGFAKPNYRENPRHHQPRYDNLPADNYRKRRSSQNPHYQNHFFTTIYDSDGANGFDPMGSFERQNSNGFDPLGNSFERQHSNGFDPVRSFERRNSNGFDPLRSFERRNSNGFDPLGSFERQNHYQTHYVQEPDWQQMDEIHVEATLPISSTRESPKVEDQEDIMQRLEEAIAKGNHKEASVLAKEVTKLQISTKLSLKELIEKKNDKKVEKINLNMYVEDRTSYNGPVQVTVKPDFTLAELKEHVQCEFEIPVGVQKWILGKSLAEDDRSKLSSHGITQSGQSIYLYLVAPKEDAQQQQVNSKTKTAAAVVASAAATAASASPQILKKPMEKPMEEYIKGRYWNYEMDRWSYCSSEEDEDEIEADKNIPKVEENGDNKEEEEEEGDYEWEYFYEDAEMKKEQQQKVKVEEKEQKPSGKTQRVNPRDGWECPSCTLLNEPHRPGCEACTTERPKDYEVPPPGPLDTIPRGATAAAEPAKPAKPGPVPSRLKPLVKETPKVEAKKETKEKDDILKNYKKLDDLDIIPNVEPFECIICYLDIEPGDGVVLRECLHTFCKECLAGAIQHSDAPQVTCPFKDDSYSCDMTLLDREIKALVSKTVYEKHQQKSLKEAQVSAKNSFHCKTPDCQGFCFVTDDVNSFKCPICKRLNCITCQAVHEGLDCKQYQQATLNEAQDENSLKTKEWIEGLIKGGEALNCPSCQVILLKKWGCDWVRCTYCRTEICWVTKQLRWGPNGRGDTSGGCKCMVDGRTKCHPLCNYCH